jgi:hypothetical protein
MVYEALDDVKFVHVVGGEAALDASAFSDVLDVALKFSIWYFMVALRG